MSITDEQIAQAEKELDVERKLIRTLKRLDPEKRERVLRALWELYKPLDP